VDGIKYAKFIFSGSSIPIELNIVKPEKTLDVTILLIETLSDFNHSTDKLKSTGKPKTAQSRH